jgi:hypothetical protein
VLPVFTLVARNRDRRLREQGRVAERAAGPTLAGGIAAEINVDQFAPGHDGQIAARTARGSFPFGIRASSRVMTRR